MQRGRGIPSPASIGDHTRGIQRHDTRLPCAPRRGDPAEVRLTVVRARLDLDVWLAGIALAEVHSGAQFCTELVGTNPADIDFP